MHPAGKPEVPRPWTRCRLLPGCAARGRGANAAGVCPPVAGATAAAEVPRPWTGNLNNYSVSANRSTFPYGSITSSVGPPGASTSIPGRSG
ncbi:hypothetical protein GCM10009741_28350 [Kribbella lupini]|uniref:Uncharacterized protein n=1 Tax=Kribbella lupini TaxID=291602 RepID=A0ABN2ATU9_9ACTN